MNYYLSYYFILIGGAVAGITLLIVTILAFLSIVKLLILFLIGIVLAFLSMAKLFILFLIGIVVMCIGFCIIPEVPVASEDKE
jgi:hypothetical protein